MFHCQPFSGIKSSISLVEKLAITEFFSTPLPFSWLIDLNNLTPFGLESHTLHSRSTDLLTMGYSTELDHHGNFITMTAWWVRWRLKSPVSRLFTQPFIQAQIKGNLKTLHHWPLLGEFTGHRWIPCTKGQERGKCFHLMTSSCWKTITRCSRVSWFHLRQQWS